MKVLIQRIWSTAVVKKYSKTTKLAFYYATKKEKLLKITSLGTGSHQNRKTTGMNYYAGHGVKSQFDLCKQQLKWGLPHFRVRLSEWQQQADWCLCKRASVQKTQVMKAQSKRKRLTLVIRVTCGLNKKIPTKTGRLSWEYDSRRRRKASALLLYPTPPSPSASWRAYSHYPLPIGTL